MTTKVRLVATPTGRNRFYAIISPMQAVDILYGGEDAEYEDVELRDGELGQFKNVSFVLSSDPELAPPKPIIDARYRGKCKKFRKEARGWG